MLVGARSRSGALVVAVVAALGLGGCGTSHAAHPSGSARAPAPGGPVTVFAAASLTGAFEAARAPLVASDRGLSITYNFAGSNALATLIAQGAPADVFASADQKNMDKLVAAGLVDTPVSFARNRLMIAVAAGNPKHITSLSDLARPGLTVVLEAPGVPAGDYARQVLNAQHINLRPQSLETDVKSALAKVSAGEADATIVYVTDVRAAGPAVAGVALPGSIQPNIDYPIAVVRGTGNLAAARAFVASALHGAVQRALVSAGFLPPG